MHTHMFGIKLNKLFSNVKMNSEDANFMLYFTELHDCVLCHIHTMFLSGSVEVKSSVIAMFNKLGQNMVCFNLKQIRVK